MRLDFPPGFEAGQLEEFRLHFEAGDKNALIRAIKFCFNQEIVAPEWVVAAFFRATNKWYSMEVKELGEAFGLARRKGVNINALKKKRRLQFAVFNAVHDARQRQIRVDDELFEAIGAKLHIGKTLAKEYLRSARAIMAPSFKDILLEPFKINTATPIQKPRQRRKK